MGVNGLRDLQAMFDSESANTIGARPRRASRSAKQRHFIAPIQPQRSLIVAPSPANTQVRKMTHRHLV